MRIWECKIGEVDSADLPKAADGPMQEAVRKAYRELTGREPTFTFTGWGGSLTESERAVVEDREPDPSLFVLPVEPAVRDCPARPGGDPERLMVHSPCGVSRWMHQAERETGTAQCSACGLGSVLTWSQLYWPVVR